MVDLTNKKRTNNTTPATTPTAGGGGHAAAANGTKPPMFSPFPNVFSTPSPSASPNPAPFAAPPAAPSSAASAAAPTSPSISTAMLSLKDVAGKLIVVRKESIGHLLVGQDLRSYKRINGNANDKIRMKFTIPNTNPNPNPNHEATSPPSDREVICDEHIYIEHLYKPTPETNNEWIVQVNKNIKTFIDKTHSKQMIQNSRNRMMQKSNDKKSDNDNDKNEVSTIMHS